MTHVRWKEPDQIVRRTAASPWPPPPHRLTAAVPPPRRLSSSRAVRASRVPDIPTGCPRAMAPPFTLTTSSLIPRSSADANPRRRRPR